MKTMNLTIEDSFFPHFKTMIDSLVKDKKVKIIDDDENYDFENNYSQNAVVSSIEEVRRRVFETEQEEGITQEDYELFMNKFFKEKLGIQR